MRLYGDPILRKTASPVTRFDAALARLAEDMVATMYHHNGIGLAAPQIGLAKRLFVAAEVEEPGEHEDEDAPPPMTTDEKRQRWGVVQEHVMINPRILERGGVQHGVDGCLSIPGLYVDEMERAARVLIGYQDVCGREHRLEAGGRFAHVLQHECDHLDGVLFFDRLPEALRRTFLAEHRGDLAQMQRDAKAFLKDRGAGPVASIR